MSEVSSPLQKWENQVFVNTIVFIPVTRDTLHTYAYYQNEGRIQKQVK